MTLFSQVLVVCDASLAGLLYFVVRGAHGCEAGIATTCLGEKRYYDVQDVPQKVSSPFCATAWPSE